MKYSPVLFHTDTLDPENRRHEVTRERAAYLIRAARSRARSMHRPCRRNAYRDGRRIRIVDSSVEIFTR